MKICIYLLTKKDEDNFYILERMDNKIKHKINNPISFDMNFNKNDVDITNTDSLFINFKKSIYFDFDKVNCIDNKEFIGGRVSNFIDTTYWKIHTDKAVLVVIDNDKRIFGNGFELNKLALNNHLNDITKDNRIEIKPYGRLILKEIINSD